MSAEIDTLHKPFADWLRREKIPYIRARSDKKSRIALGAHDFTVFLGSHRCLCIEFKDKEGKLSPDQQEWIKQMEGVGATVYVIRQLQQAVDLVQEWRRNLPPANPAPSHPEGAKSSPAPNTAQLRLLQWNGTVWVVEPGPRNGWNPIRRATPADLISLQKV